MKILQKKNLQGSLFVLLLAMVIPFASATADTILTGTRVAAEQSEEANVYKFVQGDREVFFKVTSIETSGSRMGGTDERSLKRILNHKNGVEVRGNVETYDQLFGAEVCEPVRLRLKVYNSLDTLALWFVAQDENLVKKPEMCG